MNKTLPIEMQEMLLEASKTKSLITFAPFKFRIERSGTIDLYTLNRTDDERIILKRMIEKIQMIWQEYLHSKGVKPIYASATNAIHLNSKQVLNKVKTEIIEPYIIERNKNKIIDIDNSKTIYNLHFNDNFSLNIAYSLISNEYKALSIQLTPTGETVIYYIDKNMSVEKFRLLPTNKMRALQNTDKKIQTPFLRFFGA